MVSTHYASNNVHDIVGKVMLSQRIRLTHSSHWTPTSPEFGRRALNPQELNYTSVYEMSSKLMFKIAVSQHYHY